ncbi:hypothetical protein BJX63DRAFT_11958 [Aspergillus granulosus]|uniref:Zn(2)-C6 fungal-type domain-containing protein n=1 Tax=Aspergillus granulosus TaxID=176169 RepID=A0ABR4HVW7_9EURO
MRTPGSPQTNFAEMDLNTSTSTSITRRPGDKRRIRPSRGRGLRTSTGCLTCRERRVKCDDGKPSCLRCSKSGRVCRYRQPAEQQKKVEEARHAANGTGTGTTLGVVQEQPSVDTPYFQPPTDASISLQLNGQNDTSPQSSLDLGFSAPPLALGERSLLNISSPFEWYDLLARDAISNIQRLNEASSGEPRWNFPEITLSRKPSPAPESFPASSEQRRDEEGIKAPVLDYHHVSEPWNTAYRIGLSAVDLIFLRYYTEVVGPILDLFDPDRHFTNVVPHLGLRNTGLLKSILAVGAKHMSLDVSGDHAAPHNPNSPGSLADHLAPAHMATNYYYETLQYLSQTLLYPSYADSREILATSTMISTYEMFDADTSSTSGDWERHLRGSFWIQRSQDNDGESADGLRRAVWWAWLRQDIWAAFRAGRPTLTIWRARKKLEDLNSDELANRIIYICAKCVEFAASDKTAPNSQDPRLRIEQGDRLLRALDDWYRVLPISYQPVTVAMDPASARALNNTIPHPTTSPGGLSWDGAEPLTAAAEPQEAGPSPSTGSCTGSNTVVFPPVWIHPPSHAGAMQMYHFARAVVLLNQPTMGGLNAYNLREKQLSESVQMVCGIANACQEHESAIAFVNAQALFGVGQFVQSPGMRAELLRILENMLRISKIPAQGLVAELKKVWQG